MQDLINLAGRLADEAGAIIRGYFRQDLDVVDKDDASPVTVADQAVEKRLREIVGKERPQDGILGEEYAAKESANGLTWIFDPIDGTKSFVIGRPNFGTLIALWEGDRPLLGVIDQPVTRERWLGVQGQQTTWNGTPVKTAPCRTLTEASANSTSPRQIHDLYPRLYETCRIVVWGGDCYSYGLLANGGLDMVIETGLSLHDYAALVPVVENAGGLICDWQGQPLTGDSDGTILALGNPALKDEALAFLAE